MKRLTGLLGVLVIVIAGCASGASPSGSQEPSGTPSATQIPGFPAPPAVTEGPLDPAVSAAIDRYVTTLLAGNLDEAALDIIAASEDALAARSIQELLGIEGAAATGRACSR